MLPSLRPSFPQGVAALASLAVLLLGMLGAPPAGAQTRELAAEGQLLDRVAAVVNDGLVLQSELDDQIAVISERLKQQKLELPSPSVLRQQVLERLVMQEIELQRAKRPTATACAANSPSPCCASATSSSAST